MTLKKIISALSITALAFSLAACAPSSESAPGSDTAEGLETPQEAADKREQQAPAPAERITINLGVLKGPTGMGAAQLMEDNEDDSSYNHYEFTVAASPDEITAKIINGELTAAAVPTNLASVLYNKTEGQIQIAAVNTLGTLYILENGGTISSAADLSGKTIYSAGQGATPEYCLNYILEKNNITDAEVVFKSEHAEVVSALASGEADIALLPEPNVTAALSSVEGLRIALDITDEWRKAGGGELVMGCIIAQKDFINANPVAFDEFLNEYRDSIDYTNNSPAAAAELMEKFGIVPKSAVALKAIPTSNIAYMDGGEMKTAVSSYLEILMEADAKSVGGELPDDEFYFEKQ